MRERERERERARASENARNRERERSLLTHFDTFGASQQGPDAISFLVTSFLPTALLTTHTILFTTVQQRPNAAAAALERIPAASGGEQYRMSSLSSLIFLFNDIEINFNYK